MTHELRVLMLFRRLQVLVFHLFDKSYLSLTKVNVLPHGKTAQTGNSNANTSIDTHTQ